MKEAETRFETAHARKYLQQMCKHFAHKVPAEWDESRGRVELPLGECLLAADDAALTIACRAHAEEGLPRLAKVVAVHLERFAFREPPALAWTAAGAPATALMAALAALPDPHGEAPKQQVASGE